MNDFKINNITMQHRLSFSRHRETKLGSMLHATEGDKIQFTYNDKIREGFIDFIWKKAAYFGDCYMCVNFRDGMEDAEQSEYKNFSLNQVEDFKVIESERWSK